MKLAAVLIAAIAACACSKEPPPPPPVVTVYRAVPPVTPAECVVGDPAEPVLANGSSRAAAAHIRNLKRALRNARAARAVCRRALLAQTWPK